jgi:hypothetical protein
VRFLPILLVVGLLAGSAAAFAVTENLKLERSPIYKTRVDKLFAPGCNCAQRSASIGFRLRKADRLNLVIVDRDGDVVRTLVTSRHLRAGSYDFAWDGRDDEGRPVDDAVYRPRVHLAAQHRTILLPNSIRVDTAAPSVKVSHVNTRVISPDGDNRHDYLKVAYRASEDARALLYANGKLVQKRKFFRAQGYVVWPRTVLLSLPTGSYRVVIRAEDRAGNLSPPTHAFVVRVRYIQLSPQVVHVASGARFSVRVSTDARRYRWRIASRHGSSRARRLSLAAGVPGRYVLVVSANGHSDRALLIVGGP